MKDVRFMLKETWVMLGPYLLIVMLLAVIESWEPMYQLVHYYIFGEDGIVEKLNWKVPI